MNAAIQLLLPILKSFAQDEIDALAALPTQAAKRERLLEWLDSSFVSGSPGGYVASAVIQRSTRAQDALIDALAGVRLNPTRRAYARTAAAAVFRNAQEHPRAGRPTALRRASDGGWDITTPNPSTTVQSLVFDRSSFGVEHAKAWAKAHGFRYGDVDVQPTTIRLRQKDPSRFRTFRTKGLTQGVQAVIARNPVRRRRNPPVTNPLLAQMLALRTAYQYAHWNAQNYADHLLFEKLYTSLDGGIDILAEISQQHVEPVATPKITDRSLMAAENRIIKAAERAIEQDRPDPGLENFLLGLIEHRERAKYLLNQRSDRAANLDTEEREYREAALEGGVYKNPTRYDVATAPLGKSTKGQGPDLFIIDPETGRRRKMTVAELRRYARAMRSMAEDAPAYSRATYEASAEWHEDAADRLERRSARQKARKASIEGGVYKNPTRRRRNPAVQRGSRVRVPQEHNYVGTVVAIGAPYAGGPCDYYLVRFGSGREGFFSRDEIEPVQDNPARRRRNPAKVQIEDVVVAPIGSVLALAWENAYKDGVESVWMKEGPQKHEWVPGWIAHGEFRPYQKEHATPGEKYRAYWTTFQRIARYLDQGRTMFFAQIEPG